MQRHPNSAKPGAFFFPIFWILKWHTGVLTEGQRRDASQNRHTHQSSHHFFPSLALMRPELLLYEASTNWCCHVLAVWLSDENLNHGFLTVTRLAPCRAAPSKARVPHSGYIAVHGDRALDRPSFLTQLSSAISALASNSNSSADVDAAQNLTCYSGCHRQQEHQHQAAKAFCNSAVGSFGLPLCSMAAWQHPGTSS